MQLLQLSTPVLFENESQGQGWHTGKPGPEANVPALQAVHDDDPAEADFPAAQSVQVSLEVAPKEDETLPAGHLVQTAAASAAEYVPGPHSSQSVSLSLPSDARYLPSAQEIQVAELVCCFAIEYLPVSHLVQTDAFSSAEYVPGPHSTQSVSASLPSVSRYLPAAQL